MEWNLTDERAPAGPVALEAYVERIDEYCARRPDLSSVRTFNHQMVDVLEQVRGVSGRRILDVGASYAGFALERSLALGAREYVGISLQVADPHDVRTPEGVGRLLNMDAEALALPDGSFDLALSLSSFEHFSDGARVLGELHRVLVPGGAAFVSFEPIWTCSYGHHLHHLPELSRLLAPWAHLLWSPETMRTALAPDWPTRAALSLDEAVHWVYQGPFINRLPIDALRLLFERSPFEIEWQVPLRDTETDGKPELARYLERLLPWSADELMTIGFSILLVKP